VIFEAIEQQSESLQWAKQDGRYIPHPSTWINDRRWEDETTEALGERMRHQRNERVKAELFGHKQPTILREVDGVHIVFDDDHHEPPREIAAPDPELPREQWVRYDCNTDKRMPYTRALLLLQRFPARFAMEGMDLWDKRPDEPLPAREATA
jgi:hypothetical protein